MADVATYRVFTDAQLAEELIRLNKARQQLYDSQTVGDRSFTKNLDRVDRDFSQAMKAWGWRGYEGIPESKDGPYTAAANKNATTGGTDYGGIRIS